MGRPFPTNHRRRFMKKTAILASVLMMGAAMPALANDMKSSEDVQAKFTKMDTDKNGVLSKSEADAAGKAEEDFSSMDTDKNGSVSLAELKTWKQKEWNQSSNMGSNAVDNHGRAN